MNRIQLRFGQSVGIKELIATLVVSGVLLIVGTVVFARVKNSMGYQFNESVNATNSDAVLAVQDIEGTTFDAFQLAVVALIVLAAATIIGILLRAFGG